MPDAAPMIQERPDHDGVRAGATRRKYAGRRTEGRSRVRARLHGSVPPGNRRPYRDEADIESFFDSLDRTRLEEMLQIRVADRRRLVGKPRWSAGEEDGARGTPQGSGRLGNLYLHYGARGEAVVVRTANTFVSHVVS